MGHGSGASRKEVCQGLSGRCRSPRFSCYLAEAYGGYHLNALNAINIDAGIFISYMEKPPKPYTKQELKELFEAMTEEEKLLYSLFLNSGVLDAEMQNTEYANFNLENCHIRRTIRLRLRVRGGT